MPAILKDALLFPYTSGLTMTLGAFQQAGGYTRRRRAVRQPARHDRAGHPPREARRAGAGRSPVAFPDDFAGSLGEGWTIALQDTLGEFQLRTLLSDAAPRPRDANAAATGWGGDRVA